MLCGGLDYQVEHHLFPRLAPQRLRKIGPEVQAICEEHGVPYRTASWPKTLLSALERVAQLSKPEAPLVGPEATRAAEQPAPAAAQAPAAA